MKKFIIYSLLPFLLMAFIISLIIINKNKIIETKQNELMDMYPFITKEEEFNAIIISFHHGDQNLFRNDPYHAYITLSSGVKRSLAADIKNEDMLYLDDIISVGDS